MDCAKCNSRMIMQDTGDTDVLAVPQCLYCGYEDYANARMRSRERSSALSSVYARYRGEAEKSKDIVVEMRVGKRFEPICPFCEGKVRMEFAPYMHTTAKKMGNDVTRHQCANGHRIWIFANDMTWK